MKALLVVSTLTYIGIAKATDYCSPELCPHDERQHIACGNDRNFSPNCPPDARILDLTPYISTILHLHNEKRNEIAGGHLNGYLPAGRMATMQWDKELAELATLNVMQCRSIHDCHGTKAFPYSGQNLGYGTFNLGRPEDKVKEIIEMWYQEHKIASMQTIYHFAEKPSPNVVGHFTVMVNDKNTHVGCAASIYTSDQKYYLIACNYAANNMLGEQVYQPSNKPASKCLTGPNPKYKNLCSPAEQYSVPIQGYTGYKDLSVKYW